MMKNVFLIIAVFMALSSCSIPQNSYQTPYREQDNDLLITYSLFNDKTSTISENNIKTILDGKYILPEKLRIALVKIEKEQGQLINYKYYGYMYLTDENHLKAQQAYLDLFTKNMYNSQRVVNVLVMPDLLISNNPTFTNIREAAVRTQSDLVAIYSITNELYTKWNWFSKDDLKAFATIQFIILDVRTGLIPFSTIVTKDYQSKGLKSDYDSSEAKNRVKKEAVLLAINEIGEQLNKYLREN
jgi:hypothetical protein